MITQSILLLRIPHGVYRASMMTQTVRNPPAMQEMQEMRLQSLGLEDPLEEEISAHTSILVWKIPRTEKPGWLQAMGSQRVRHNLATQHSTHNHINVKVFLTF